MEQRRLTQKGMDYDPVVDRECNLQPFVAQEGMVAMPTRRQAGMEPSTLS